MGSRHELWIDALDDEGRGRGLLHPEAEDHVRVDVAVRGAQPGDRVQMIVERVFPARRLVIGRATGLVEASEARRPGACGHAWPTVCCPLDGWDISLQTDFKRGRILRALEDAGLGPLELLVDDVVLPRHPLGRRQKIKLVAAGRAGLLRLGLYAPWSRVLVPGHACAYTRPELVAAVRELGRRLDASGIAPATESRPGGLRAVVLRAFLEGVGAVLVMDAAPDEGFLRQMNALVDEGHLASMAVRIDASTSGSIVGGTLCPVYGPAHMTPLEGGPPASVDAFCQADPGLARWMYRFVAEYLAAGPLGTIVDAYAGTGGFARALLDAERSDILAIEQAEANVATLRGLGIDALAQSVEEALPRLAAGGPLVGIVVDPPKKGLGEVAAPLAQLGAARLALVSCAPDAMARDLRVLVDHGYVIERIVPVDLFSGTTEIEAITLLSHSLPDASQASAPSAG